MERLIPTANRNETQSSAKTQAGGGLSCQQKKAAALLAGGLRKTAVAETVGVNPATLWRWEQEPAFLRVLEREQQECLAATRSLVLAAPLKALELLTKVIDDNNADLRDRLTAAKAILAVCPPPEAPVPKEKTKREQTAPVFTQDEARVVAYQLLQIRLQNRRQELEICEEMDSLPVGK